MHLWLLFVVFLYGGYMDIKEIARHDNEADCNSQAQMIRENMAEKGRFGKGVAGVYVGIVFCFPTFERL